MDARERKHQEVEALKCADCARSDSADRDLKPSALMPLPAEALVGFPDGTPAERGFTRRSLLKHGVAGTLSVYAATRLDWGAVWEEAAANAAEPMQKSLVCVYLNGGNDGGNMFVPIEQTVQYPRYRNDARPTIYRENVGGADTPSTPQRVGTKVMPGSGANLAFANVGVSGAGNNGDAIGFDTLYGDGTGGPGSDLAVFAASGYPNSTRSHFDGRDIWFRANPAMESTGWLGRWLDAYGSKVNPLQAVSLDSSLSKQIRSATAPVSALEDLSGISFSVPDGSSSFDVTPQIGDLATVASATQNEAILRSRGVYGLTVDVSARLQALQNVSGGAGYPPNSSLSSKLQLAAILLSAGLGTRIVTIDWGSFDNHGSQLTSHDPQLAVLSRALAAFKNDLAARGIENQVVTLVFSEFGRQIYQNDSNGTDHGDAGPILVSGSAVRGGYCGEFPGIPLATDSDAISMVTDFRLVYQQLIAEWLGGDPAAILHGNFGAIDRFDDNGANLIKAA
jgi:uncharacterized protein (DUF1501 family)